MRIVVAVLVAVVACACDSPPPFPSKRPADFTLEVRVNGSAAGIDESFALRGDRLTIADGRNPHDVQLTEHELDAVYQQTLRISRVHDRPPHRKDVADDFYASLVASGGGARLEVGSDRDPSDAIGLSRTLSTLENMRATGPVDLPAVRPDDFSLTLDIAGARGSNDARWSARIDARGSYVYRMNRPGVAIHPTREELDRLYATCRSLAASPMTSASSAGNEHAYQLDIVAGGRHRVFSGAITSLAPETQRRFSGLRAMLDAMIPADGTPWPDTTVMSQPTTASP